VRLRLLRDNISLTRQAYVEFDLEAMMAGEAYPDFVLLWLLLHQSRFEPSAPSNANLRNGLRPPALRVSVCSTACATAFQRSIEHLGQGFLAHPANTALREHFAFGRTR